MSFDKTLALSAAKEYMLQNNLQAAIEIYRKIVEADPEDLASSNTLGDLYARANRVQDAVSEFSKLADSYLAGGLPRKAIAALKKLMAIDAGNTRSWIKLADVYAQAGLPTEARQHYLQIAEAYGRAGQMREALVLYGKVVDLDPSNASARIKLGELYLREGMNDQAYEAFVTAAAQLAERGERRRALNAYNEALAIKPDSAEALAALSKLNDGYEGLSNTPALTAALGRSISEAAMSSGSLDPLPSLPGPDPAAQSRDNGLVVHEISNAEILVAYGQVDQAISMLREVVKKLPDNVDVRIKLKDIYLRNGMTVEGAVECRELERIYRARGDDARARDYAVRASRLTQLKEQPSGDLAVAKQEPAKGPEPAKVRERPMVAPQSPPVLSESVVGNIPIDKPRPTPIAATPPEVRPVQSNPMPRPAAAPPEARPVQSNPMPRPAAAPPEVLPVQSNPMPQPAAAPPEVRPVQSNPVPQPAAAPPEVLPVQSNPMPRPAPPQQPLRRVPSVITETPQPIKPVTLVAPASVVEPAAETSPERLVTTALVVTDSLQAADDAMVSLVKPATASPVTVKKRSRFTVAAIAAGVVAMLATGAVIGGFVFDTRLNKQYEALTMAPSPADTPPEASASPAQSEPESPQTVEPITMVVTPSDKPDRPTRNDAPEAKRHETPQPVSASAPSEPAKETARPTPPPASPPRTSVNQDSHAVGENRTPTGVPTGVPTGTPSNAPAPSEPPQKATRVSEGVVLGGAVKKVEPGYPAGARDARLSGTVRVEVSIDERGNVSSARAVSGPALLQGAAVNAARGWKFKPSTMGGAPVKTSTVIVFNFKL